MRHTRWIFCFALLLASAIVPASAADRPQRELLIFAAASLTDVLNEIGAAYARETRQSVKFSFAASSALARQIEAGARVDVFFPADAQWLEYLRSRNLLDGSTLRDIAASRLVLAAPADSAVQLQIAPGFALAAALGSGRLATGDPDTVPVGRYARAALLTLGVWDEVADRLVRADNVRSALAFIARGEAPLGIVYATDARVEPRVRIVDTFPASAHPPIIYSAAATRTARAGAREFIAFLQGPSGQSALRAFGFRPLPPD